MIYPFLYLVSSLLFLLLFSKWKKNITFTSLLSAFGLGMLFAPLAGVLNTFLSSHYLLPEASFFDMQLNKIILYFLIVSPVEEILKFFAMLLPGLRNSSLRTTSDSMILGVAAALGFAAIENIFYLLFYGVSATIPRLMLGNLGHAAYSSFWAYAAGAVLAEGAPVPLLAFSLILSMLLHGLYNLLLSFSIPGVIFAMMFSLLLYAFFIRFIAQEKKRNSPPHKSKK